MTAFNPRRFSLGLLLAVALLAQAACPGGDPSGSADADAVTATDAGDTTSPADTVVASDTALSDTAADADAAQDSGPDAVPDTTADTSGPTDTGDTTPDPDLPTVTIVSPQDGAFVFGTTALIAEATDDSGMVSAVRFVLVAGGVELCADLTAKATDPSADFGCTFDARTLATGGYDVLARATDPDGNEGVSEPIRLQIEGAAPEGTLVVAGTVTPPAGASPTDYEIGNAYASTTPSSDGSFELPVKLGGTTFTFAAPLATEGQNSLIAVTALAAGADGSGITLQITPETTATALTVMHPDLATSDPVLMSRLIASAEANPTVAALSAVVAQTFGHVLFPFATTSAGDPDHEDTVRFRTAYDAATVALGRQAWVSLPAFAASIGVTSRSDVWLSRLDTQGQLVSARPLGTLSRGMAGSRRRPRRDLRYRASSGRARSI